MQHSTSTWAIPPSLDTHGETLRASLRSSTFTAIDFETASCDRDSACAIGLVRVEAGRVVRREYRLIRP